MLECGCRIIYMLQFLAHTAFNTLFLKPDAKLEGKKGSRLSVSQLSACGRITGWETRHMEDRRETREWFVNWAYTLLNDQNTLSLGL